MTILLELDPETEARLKAQAERRGMAPEQYAGEFLRENLPSRATEKGKLTREGLHAMLREVGEGSENLPKLPTSAFTRESFYEDRT
jgi:hypothetical protein